MRQKQVGLFVVALSFLLVLVFFAIIALGLIQPAFKKLEKQQIKENIGRVKAGIEKQIEKVKQINQDWSNWDDMALFTQNKFPGFIQANLADFGFQEKNIGINLCFIFDKDKKLLYSQLWETDLGGELPIDQELALWNQWENLIGESWKKDQPVSGLVKIDSFPVLLSVGPIFNSSGGGIQQGWLIFGRFLDEPTIKDISNSTQIPFEVGFIDNSSKKPLTENNNQRIETSIINDIKDSPLLEIRMPVPDTIQTFQQNLLLYMLFAFAIILLFFIFIYAFFTKKMEEELVEKGTRTKNSAKGIVLLVVLAGILFSISIFWFLNQQNATHMQTTFLEDSTERLSSIQHGENDIIPELQWLRRVFIYDEEVSKIEFTRFVKPLLQTKPFSSIDWIQKQKDGKYELFYHESSDNSQSKGFDLSSMDQARDSGLTTCSLPFQDHGDTSTFEITVFVPVFSLGSPQTIESRRKELKGFIAGTIQLDSFFHQAISSVAAKGLCANFFDVVNSQKSILLYTHIPRVGSSNKDPKSKLEFISSFKIANREFLIEIAPNKEYLQKQASYYQWIFLFFGLIITMLLSLFLFRTLTQKDQAEYLVKIKTRELNASREKYRCTLQSIGDGVITVDSDGIITGLNPVAETLTGWTESEAMGKVFEDIFNIISASTGKKAENPLIQALKTEKVVKLSNDTTLISRTGHQYQIADSAAPIVDTQGNLAGAVMVFHDVTSEYEIKKSLLVQEEQLKAQNILLHELMGKKDELLSIAAHDIRSPLTVIKGYADLLLMYSKDTLSGDQIEMISKIQGSTKFIIQLLNDLLDFSALESGKVNLDKQSVDLESYMKTYIVNTIIVAHQKSMEIESDIQIGLPLVSFDPMKIQQVLNNLTSNAIKFSNPGSDIQITVKADQKFVSISVKDCGQGIPENEMSKLFTPFQKTSVKSTGGEKSTGLGLVIARNIVRAHGGEMYIESEVGKGSTFTFTLPLLAVNIQP